MLTALVVTIIVLLILAGVAIATLFSDNGIINRTISAKNLTDIAGAKEEVELYAQEFLIDFRTQSLAQGSTATTLADYIAEQLNGRDALGYSVSTTGKNVTLSKDGQDVAKGSVNDGGKIIWGSVQDSNTEPTEPEGPVTSNLSSAEQTALAENGMAELTASQINSDAGLTSEQKSALTDKTKVKAVLSGNVPVPVGYDYKEGTSTALNSKPNNGSWGVVVTDENDNEWVWVPVNREESVSVENMFEQESPRIVDVVTSSKTKQNEMMLGILDKSKNNVLRRRSINGLKLASLNGLDGLQIAESSSSSEESVEEEKIFTVEYYRDGSLYREEQREIDDEYYELAEWEVEELTWNEGYYYQYISMEPEHPSKMYNGDTIKVYYGLKEEAARDFYVEKVKIGNNSGGV